MASDSLLEVRNLEVRFAMRRETLVALRDVSFSVNSGERLGIVGESGAGKSVAAFSILNLISKPGFISAGEIILNGRDLTKLSQQQLRKIRGGQVSMIFQDPMMTLNPVLAVGTQLVEVLHAHESISKAEAIERAVETLALVKIPSPAARMNQYPHELSGGMRQRVVIASALMTKPSLIIADEPTTALDVTIQAEIMDLLLELCENSNVALILITHDLGVVSQVTQRMIVMYAGRIVEEGPTRELIRSPRHPYTRGLLSALPQQTEPGCRLNQISGVMPALTDVPSGCAFHPRCGIAEKACGGEVPPFVDSESWRVACYAVAEGRA